LRTWLAVSSVTICLAIVAVFVLGTLHARDLAIETARNSAENLAASLYGQASDTFEAVDAVLLTLSERVEMNGTAAAQRIRLRDSMAALVTNLPALRSLGVFDEHGRSLSTNLSATPGWWSVTHQPSFQYHRTHPGSSLHISGPARDQSDHVYEIFVSRRIDRADGSFGGVVASHVPSSVAASRKPACSTVRTDTSRPAPTSAALTSIGCCGYLRSGDLPTFRCRSKSRSRRANILAIGGRMR
jgi:hypothetical protein